MDWAICVSQVTAQRAAACDVESKVESKVEARVDKTVGAHVESMVESGTSSMSSRGLSSRKIVSDAELDVAKDVGGLEVPYAAARMASISALVERFDIEPFSDFSAK